MNTRIGLRNPLPLFPALGRRYEVWDLALPSFSIPRDLCRQPIPPALWQKPNMDGVMDESYLLFVGRPAPFEAILLWHARYCSSLTFSSQVRVKGCPGKVSLPGETAPRVEPMFLPLQRVEDCRE